MADRWMNRAGADAPAPSPIDRISPSLGEALAACALQVVFARDQRFRHLRRPNPASSLGLVSHELTEAVATGAFDAVEDASLDDALKQAWDARAEMMQRELEDAWPLGSVPRPERWPGYGPTRRRLLRRLVEQASAHRDDRSAAHARAAIEQALQPEGLPLLGRPDRVEQGPEGPEIVDLKSGWTVGDELRPAHRRQLLVYAFLWHSVHDEWPASASVQRLNGTRISFRIVPEEAEAAVAELLELRARFNTAVGAAAPPWSLASPSAEACMYCDFRAACTPFFEAISEDWGYYRRDLLGVVRDIATVDVRTRIDVVLEAGNLPRGVSQARVIGLPPDRAPKPGSRIALIDVLPTPLPTEVRVGWDSSLEEW